MIFIVDATNRLRFATDLLQMHRHRKAVFVDGLGWNIPVIDHFEIDRYDRDDTIYLLAKHDANGPVLASARLLPTIQPHLMVDLFRSACSGQIPCGPSIWEVSRFCVSPAVKSRRARVLLFGEIICGIIETAAFRRVRQVTFSVNAASLPLTLACGWKAQRLGPTLPDGADQLTAIVADIDAEGLAKVRRRFRIGAAVTQFPDATTRGQPANDSVMDDALDERMDAAAEFGHQFVVPLAATQLSPA
jgi:N-acyl-L-homoserine lactone synthetase